MTKPLPVVIVRPTSVVFNTIMQGVYGFIRAWLIMLASGALLPLASVPDFGLSYVQALLLVLIADTLLDAGEYPWFTRPPKKGEVQR